ncbi:Aste57867_4097 [Aphanomyces stellatus]|uniref:Aste57867_4097 protein n=1 Tax=Aphanomyces stellatus TaxID=120398 RepID=A0A485KC44_9STRA|nr:hypothetical protein As57867_004086 [Aphanomyces stellatus]VFT81230.1 Aste57867_4097 [Aphanomyces stellatus]
MMKLFPFLTAAAVASSQGDPFSWSPCPDVQDPQVQCGALKVPLDHLHPAKNQTIDIAVRRYRAKNPKGTILLNPGGPGGAGTTLATLEFLTLTGGQHDVLGFDPRGIGASRPFKCTKNGFTGAQEQAAIGAKSVPYDTDSSDTSLGRFGADIEAQIRRCEHYDGDYLKYLSTAFVARDMDLIRAALGEDVLNYYGISYGTYIGATYANMFPTRIGRFVIDSVVDPEIFSGPATELMPYCLTHTESVFEGFGSECEAAGPTKCPLVKPSSQRDHVAANLRTFLATADESPLLLRTQDGDVAVVTGAQLRWTLFQAMYDPTTWPDVARTFASYMAGTTVPPAAASACPTPESYRGGGLEFPIFVANDGTNQQPGDWDGAFLDSKANSPLFGAPWAAMALAVKYWKTTPVERYAGPWDKKLNRPILILQNHVDPVTPIESAHHLAYIMGNNAVLVTRNGFGHGAYGQPSKCLQTITTTFFNTGKYPMAGTNCKLDVSPFESASEVAKSIDDEELENARRSVTTMVSNMHKGKF